MASYGFTFYRPNTTQFDAVVKAGNDADPTKYAATLAARYADSLNTQSGRAQVLEAFQGTSTAPILPTEAQIRQWMISGLGYKRQSFTAYYASMYNSSPTYAAQVAADRAFEDSVLSPLTNSQVANQNGIPTESTQDSFGNNTTSFVLGTASETQYYDPKSWSNTTAVNTVPTNDRVYTSVRFDGSASIVTKQNSSYFNTGGSPYSLEAWVYIFGYGTENSLFSRTAGGTYQLGTDLYINTGGYLTWELPPYSTITSNIQVPTNQWAHILVSFDGSTGRRMFINGSLVGSFTNQANEIFSRPVYSFLGDGYYYLGYFNSIQVSNAKGFSLYDKVKFYGFLPSGQASLTGEYTVYGVDYVNNRLDLNVSIARTFSTGLTGPLIAVRSTPSLRSASRRGVVAIGVSDNSRVFLDPQGQPTGYQGDYSGVTEMQPTTGNIVNSYYPGEKVMFTGTMRGGAVSTAVYYIKTVVPGGSFGGYVTLSLTNGGNTVYFNYFTDNGQTLQMYMVKVYDSVGWGTDISTGQGMSIGVTTLPTRSIANTKFRGLLGGAKFVNGYNAYAGLTTLTPTYPFTSTSVGGGVILLINSNNGTVPVNTSSIALNLEYSGNFSIYKKPKYIGSVLYNGVSSYSTVAGINGNNFNIYPGTNWCAEAWIYPIAHSGGIVGTGGIYTNYWQLHLDGSGTLSMYYDGGNLTSTDTVTLNAWHHVAVSLNGNTLRIFLDGKTVGTQTISPKYFYPQNNTYYIGLFNGAYFTGTISNVRLVNGKSIYTTDFTPSTTKPRAPRTAVLNAAASNQECILYPTEWDIQYWMYTGFDTFSTPLFRSTDITWNQIDAFYMPANTSVTKTYPFCAGKETIANQILISTPDINRAYLANTISINNSTGTVSISGGNVDAYITVLMR